MQQLNIHLDHAPIVLHAGDIITIRNGKASAKRGDEYIFFGKKKTMSVPSDRIEAFEAALTGVGMSNFKKETTGDTITYIVL